MCVSFGRHRPRNNNVFAGRFEAVGFIIVNRGDYHI